ncbi:hypothetical protein SNE26_16725 [Mucilaginibacter sp. cycad4]|uniref:hypothetical protein n=1 Tax=Mucilaginibacter sp. cycad4 TaxID=3342096 RepID=UPI002AAB942D|nr:hypothetical protein [Mucilaginibacter gossypii]WPU97673.1 hypothetical protein SNE26_16725 [Mucilaginibacter gossypii]
MTTRLSNGYLKKIPLFFTLTLLVATAAAQKKVASKTPVNTVTIAPGPVNAIETAVDYTAPAAGASGTLYSVIDVPFVIAGPMPQKDVSVKLTLQSFSPANPQFLTSSGVSQTDNEVIPRELFNGSKKVITLPVRIRFNGVPDMGGDAYIKIDKQDKAFFKVTFDKPLTAPDNRKAGSGAKKANTAANVKSSQPIALVDTASSFDLDTLRANSITTIPVTLYLMLAKGVGKSGDFNGAIKPLAGLQSLELKSSTFKVHIDSTDWDEAADIVITKNIEVDVKQTALVTQAQDLKLTIKGIPGTHTLKIKPYKTKGKDDLLKLIASGNAQIVGHNTTIITRESPSPVNLLDTVMVTVKLSGEYSAEHNRLVFSLLDTTLSKHFQILENPIEISETEWNNALKADFVRDKKDTTKKIETKQAGLITIPIHIRSVNISDSLSNIERVDIIIKGQKQALRGSQRIKLNTVDKPFWAEIGTNFDLLDKIQTNNFYAGVYMFDKDIARIGWEWTKGALKRKKIGENNLSFTAGVYETQSISSGAVSDRFDFKSAVSPKLDSVGNIKSYSFNRDTGTVSTVTKIKSIGIFFSPHLRLTSSKTEDKGLHIFVSAHFEMLWQRVTSSLDYSKTSTLYNVTDTLAPPLNYDKIPYKQKAFDFDFRSHYIGLGIPLYIKETNFNLYVNSVFGTSTQRFVVVDKTGPAKTGQYKPLVQEGVYDDLLNFSQPEKRWNMFYLFQFRLNEVAYGITFSGEIRGLFLNRSKPVVTLALSKKFNLSGLFKPLVAPYGGASN